MKLILFCLIHLLPRAKAPFFCLLLTGWLSHAVQAQDSTSFDLTRRFFVGVNVGAVKDFGKQANFFRGYNQFGIADLLAIQQVKDELYNKTGYRYTLEEYPGVMQYKAGLGLGINLLYDLGDVNLLANFGFTRLATSGVFTLSATNPSNPFGEDMIRTQTINGTERRTWIKAGAQFKNQLNLRNDFFVELAPVMFFQKAQRNEVNLEGSVYSILVQNPANVPVKTSFMGYGLNVGLGIQTLFIKNKFSQLGVNFTVSKLNMLETKRLNYSGELYLSVFL